MSNCVPVAPFSRDEPPEHDLNPDFFEEWGRRLSWPDEDMLYRATWEGGTSHSACARDTVIHTHHLGLRQHYAVARKSVDADTAEGWVSEGTRHLQFVPSRLVPKNVVSQAKWKLGADGSVARVQKWRVTTDDSIAADGTDSRNSAIDREELDKVSLPTIQQLARAVAVVRATAARWGVHVPSEQLEQVAVWALDLTSAYRRVAAARHEWWLQCFLWHDGVRLDSRCEFGSARLVDLFQLISSFVMAVARERIRRYDVAHPYSAARREWQRQRERSVGCGSCTYSDIYLDDGFGLTCTDGEPLRGGASGAPMVATTLEAGEGGVRVGLFVGLSRQEAHLAVVRRTFQEAGWDVAVDKVQLGLGLNLLGLGISTEAAGRLFVQEAKRQGLLIDISGQLEAARSNRKVSRADVEQLVGRLSHTAQVAPEGNAFLHPLYRVKCASYFVRWRCRARGGEWRVSRRRIRPRWIQITGNTPTRRAYREALRWWLVSRMATREG